MEGKISGIVQIDGSELRDIVKQALREVLQDHPRCSRCGADVAGHLPGHPTLRHD